MTGARPLALAIALACVACGGGKGPAIPADLGAPAIGTVRPLPSSVLAPPKDGSPAGVEQHALLTLPDGSIGPFLARRDDVAMAAYVGASPEGARRVVSVPLTPSGEPRSDAKVVAPIATDATMLIVRASGGARPGFVAAWTSLTDRGEALSVIGVLDDGRARGEPTELARTTEDIVWVDVVPTTRGAVALWAEQTRDGDANVLAAALGSDGAMRGLPLRLARGVTGWQVVQTPDGVGLALVTPSPASAQGRAAASGAKKTSTLTWQRLDAEARALGPAITVVSGPRVSGDVDAVRIGDQTLLGWTDGSQPDPQPVLATIDEKGHVRGPKRAIEGGAGGTLVALASGQAGAVVAWEEPFRRGRASKRVTLARVDATPTVDPQARVSLELQGGGAPELVATNDGFALLAPARACAAPSADSCDDAPVLPTYVRFDARLGVAQVDPLRLGVLRENATAGWGLSCTAKGSCLALAVSASAAEGGKPRVVSVSLRPRATSFRPPVVAPPATGAPAVEAFTTIAAGEPYVDVSASRAGDGAIAALLAASSDETAKHDDVGTISVRAFDPTGAADGASTITKRALSVGGVAIATSDHPEDGAAVAWVARDAGDPQVHVTRVDRRGKAIHDVQLTSVKGDASDVAIAWGGDSWIVAWVDARDGNGEVYATTLDRDARVVGHGQRITRAPGDASDVTLLALPDAAGPEGKGTVWIGWADPRESPQDGFADVYVAQLRQKDASRVGDESRVLGTAAHSRSPALAVRGHELAVGWIEEAPMGADVSARAYGAMLAWLGPNGRPASEPARLPLAGEGFPSAIVLDGSRGGMHAVIARAQSDAIVLDAIDLSRDRAVTAFPLLTLEGPPSLDVALGLLDDDLFLDDTSAGGETKRVRRATVRWKR